MSITIMLINRKYDYATQIGAGETAHSFLKFITLSVAVYSNIRVGSCSFESYLENLGSSQSIL